MNKTDRDSLVNITKEATELLFDDSWGEVLSENFQVLSNWSFKDKSTGIIYKLAFVEKDKKNVIYIE